uniref:Oligodendrocyte transcription factor 3-like n=1 Tax=Saccoglossus kowalevskii TaxID=10224 RepID=A0ABM0MEK3_SACKO|nr:PREDICTED: oligodendrocyte transcription factor 3-like [Saccoglossus kowalevskii]
MNGALKRKLQERVAQHASQNQENLPHFVDHHHHSINASTSGLFGDGSASTDFTAGFMSNSLMNCQSEDTSNSEAGSDIACRSTSGRRRYSNRRANSDRRNRINERERARMHQLCDAFEKLRKVLPYQRAKRGPNRQKLSKIATLLLAQNYIRALEDMLQRSHQYEQVAQCSTLPNPESSYYNDASSYYYGTNQSYDTTHMQTYASPSTYMTQPEPHHLGSSTVTNL